MLRLPTAALLGIGAVASAAALATAGSQPPGAERAFTSKCGVFPAADVAATAASLPDQRAWNQDISAAPVDPGSDAIIDYINGSGGDALHPDFGSPREYGIPYKVVGKRTKAVRVKFTAYGDESDKGKYRVPLGSPVEGGKNADGDRHVIAYDKARCELFELYRAFPDKQRKRWEADSGAIWNLRDAGLRPAGWTSADAAGLPVFAGLVRHEEVARGSVDHAIRVTFDSTRDGWLNPASHCAGDSSSAAAPPMGMRLRLRAGYDISAIDGEAKPIAAALKRYGLIVADNGSNWYFQGATSKHWDDESLNQLKEIPGSAFEVVRSQAELQSC